MNMNVRVCDKCGQHIDPQEPEELCEACTEDVEQEAGNAFVAEIARTLRARQPSDWETSDDGDHRTYEAIVTGSVAAHGKRPQVVISRDAIQWVDSDEEDDDPLLCLRVPESAWDLIYETIQCDAQSSAIDPALRARIAKAIEQVEQLDEKDLEALAEQHFNIDHEPS